jgi:hypothetical protein
LVQVWDNSHSWIYSKTVMKSVDVEVPITADSDEKADQPEDTTNKVEGKQ